MVDRFELGRCFFFSKEKCFTQYNVKWEQNLFVVSVIEIVIS